MEERIISNRVLEIKSNEFDVAKKSITNSIKSLEQCAKSFNQANISLESDWIGESGEQFKAHNEVLEKMLASIIEDLNTEVINLEKIEINAENAENQF